MQAPGTAHQIILDLPEARGASVYGLHNTPSRAHQVGGPGVAKGPGIGSSRLPRTHDPACYRAHRQALVQVALVAHPSRPPRPDRVARLAIVFIAATMPRLRHSSMSTAA